MFFKINFLKNFAIFAVKQEQACNFINKRLIRRYFIVKFAKFLRTLFFTEHLRSLFLIPGLSHGNKKKERNMKSLDSEI